MRTPRPPSSPVELRRTGRRDVLPILWLTWCRDRARQVLDGGDAWMPYSPFIHIPHDCEQEYVRVP